MVVSSQNSAGYEHAGLQPEPHQRDASDRIRNGGKSKPRPNENAPEAGLRRARKDQDVERRRRGDRWRASWVLTSPIRIDAHKELFMPTTTQSSRLGMHDALRPAADAGRRKERQTDIPSAPRSRQAMVVAERTLVKAGLRPPPPAASALTRLRSPTSRPKRSKAGSGPRASPQHSPPRGAKKAPRPY